MSYTNSFGFVFLSIKNRPFNYKSKYPLTQSTWRDGCQHRDWRDTWKHRHRDTEPSPPPWRQDSHPRGSWSEPWVRHEPVWADGPSDWPTHTAFSFASSPTCPSWKLTLRTKLWAWIQLITAFTSLSLPLTSSLWGRPRSRQPGNSLFRSLHS